MQLYLIQQEQYWNHLLKKCSYLLQGIAYGFVAVLVILVFQILMLPLQMLETI